MVNSPAGSTPWLSATGPAARPDRGAQVRQHGFAGSACPYSACEPARSRARCPGQRAAVADLQGGEVGVAGEGQRRQRGGVRVLAVDLRDIAGIRGKRICRHGMGERNEMAFISLIDAGMGNEYFRSIIKQNLKIMSRVFPAGRALRTFEAAARHLNFSRAADELGLTPAAVSYQIKDIEAQLGLALFARTSRSIRLTPAGEALAGAAADALDGLRRATARARRLARGQQTLRLSVGARFATNWLLPRLPRFRAAHPQWELSFDISDELRDFDAHDLTRPSDMARAAIPAVVTHRLFSTVVVPVCSPRLLAGPAPRSRATWPRIR